jgi:hypothetical protein
MSDFDFCYESMNSTPALAEIVNAYIVEHHGEEALSAGHLAFDDDRNLVGIRVYVTGDVDPNTHIGHNAVTPFGDQKEAWDDFVAWMKDLGVSHTMTFFRRPPFIESVEPLSPDTNLLMTTEQLTPRVGIAYHGHLITNGTKHALLMTAPRDHSHGHQDLLNGLLDAMPPEVREAMGKALVERVQSFGIELDPAVFEALNLMGKADPGNLTDEEESTVNQALRSLEAAIEREAGTVTGAQAASPMDVPDITERPKVPKAFYN